MESRETVSLSLQVITIKINIREVYDRGNIISVAINTSGLITIIKSIY